MIISFVGRRRVRAGIKSDGEQEMLLSLELDNIRQDMPE
jgi:hypothetical protein